MILRGSKVYISCVILLGFGVLGHYRGGYIYGGTCNVECFNLSGVVLRYDE